MTSQRITEVSRRLGTLIVPPKLHGDPSRDTSAVEMFQHACRLAILLIAGEKGAANPFY